MNTLPESSDEMPNANDSPTASRTGRSFLWSTEASRSRTADAIAHLESGLARGKSAITIQEEQR